MSCLYCWGYSSLSPPSLPSLLFKMTHPQAHHPHRPAALNNLLLGSPPAPVRHALHLLGPIPSIAHITTARA